jgi:short-subunit dehydrogenase
LRSREQQQMCVWLIFSEKTTPMEIVGGTVCLVTGASGGIGQAIARELHRQGAQVIVTGRRKDVLEGLGKDLRARVIPADLTVPNDVARLSDDAGPVDVLVLNAALPASGPLLDFTDAEIDRALMVNLRAPILLARRVGERMAARGSGQIIFVSSLQGKIAGGGSALYCATKFALRGFSLALREDLREHHVGVTTIFPGFIRDAGMFAEAGIPLPGGLGTRPPKSVADAVVRAVHDNPAEIDVASVEQRAAAALAALSPSLMMWGQRKLGGATVARAVAEAQRHKR